MRYVVNLVRHLNVGSMAIIFFQGVTAHLGNWFRCFPMVFPTSMCNQHNSGEENQQEAFYRRQLLFVLQESWKT